MKSDITIAQEALLSPIKEIAEELNIKEEYLEYYGKYKAKFSDELWDSIKENKDGKLVLVTAINVTSLGSSQRMLFTLLTMSKFTTPPKQFK